MPTSRLPEISWTDPDLGAQLDEACRAVGFFVLTDHGIEADSFEELRSLLRRLFDLPEADKERLTIERDNYRGFIPLGFFTPNRAEVSGARADRYEGYKLHWECSPELATTIDSSLYGPNRWPADMPELRAAISRYWAECDRVATRLLAAIAPFLGVEPDVLVEWHQLPLTNMTLLHYPPAADTTGIHPHRDTNVYTLLHPGEVAGLEIRMPDGSWLTPTPPVDALIVNTGEMLELWSGGRYRATPHRVRNHAVEHRYSFPWFLVPNHDIVVEPLLPRVDGFDAAPMPVGALSAEVWRTNWPDRTPDSNAHDLGSLDRSTDDRHSGVT